jgi:hypothetical protein
MFMCRNDIETSFNLEIRIISPTIRGLWFGINKVVDSDTINFKDLIDEIVDKFPCSYVIGLQRLQQGGGSSYRFVVNLQERTCSYRAYGKITWTTTTQCRCPGLHMMLVGKGKTDTREL